MGSTIIAALRRAVLIAGVTASTADGLAGQVAAPPPDSTARVTLTGVVLVAQTNTPLGGATVQVVDGARQIARPDGRFTVSVAAGRPAVVRILAPGFVPETRRVAADALVTPLTIQLRALGAVQLDAVRVETRQTYVVSGASSGTKLEVPLLDVPQSIQVVSRRLLEDRGITRISQAIETVSGVTGSVDYGGNGAPFLYIRGFSTEANSLRDGFRSYGYLAARDVQSAERFEVLKGPSSVLYGQSGTLGGTMNTVSKRPEFTVRRDVGLLAGSFGEYRPTIDVGGPVGGDRVAYRLNAAYTRGDSYRDFVDGQTIDVAPSVLARLGTGTLTVLGDYTRHHFHGFDFGFPAVEQALTLPRSRYYGIPGRDGGTNDGASATAFYDQPLRAGLTLHEGVTAGSGSLRAFESFVIPSDAAATEPAINFLCPRSHERSRDYAWQNELRASGRTGTVAHVAVIGTEVARTQYRNVGECVDDPIPVNLDRPDYNPTLPQASALPSHLRGADNAAVYVQDLVSLTQRVKLAAGARLDHVRSSVRDLPTGARLDEQKIWHVSPRLGAVLEPTKSFSVFGGVATSFQSQLGHVADSGSFAPELGRQMEVGVKQQAIDGRLTATVALYSLTRRNVLTSDPTNPRFSVQTGRQRSRGIEADVAAEPVDGWSITGSYALTDATVTADNDIPIGDRLLAVPRHSGTLWTRYALRAGALRGAAVGAGVVAAGARDATLPNSFLLPGYARVDASASYSGRAWTAQLNLMNAFDARYFTAGGSGFGLTIMPGASRSIQGQLRIGL